jgi:hypothetical protein
MTNLKVNKNDELGTLLMRSEAILDIHHVLR